MAVFERHGVRSALRAYWHEAGTVDGLFYNNAPTASYWAYKWYGDQSGNIVQTVRGSWLEGVAAYDSTRKIVNVVFGGDSGNNTIRVIGLSALGSSVKATIVRSNTTGRYVNQSAPVAVSSGTYTVSGGAISVPVSGINEDNEDWGVIGSEPGARQLPVLRWLLLPSEEPGLGVDIDEELASKFPYRPAALPVNRLEDGTMYKLVIGLVHAGFQMER